LQNIAAEIEKQLKDEKVPVEKDLLLLKAELNTVLEELAPLPDKSAEPVMPEIQDSEQILTIIKKLEVMLDEINPECVNLLGEIRAIPGTEELVRLIENYDFKEAAGTLTEIKKNWEK